MAYPRKPIFLIVWDALTYALPLSLYRLFMGRWLKGM